MKDLGEVAETIDNAVGGAEGEEGILREKPRVGSYQRSSDFVWIGLRQRRGVDERRSERKTGNEYERGYFREDLAAVRAHHRRRFRAPHKTKGMREPDPRRGKCHGDGAGKKHETEREK